MAVYAVLYSDVTGFVLGAWPRTTSDNIATMIADGHLTVDGVRVVEGLGEGEGDAARTDIAGFLATDPTFIDPGAPLGTLEVDDAESPTDVDDRADEGRDPYYPYME